MIKKLKNHKEFLVIPILVALLLIYCFGLRYETFSMNNQSLSFLAGGAILLIAIIVCLFKETRRLVDFLILKERMRHLIRSFEIQHESFSVIGGYYEVADVLILINEQKKRCNDAKTFEEISKVLREGFACSSRLNAKMFIYHEVFNLKSSVFIPEEDVHRIIGNRILFVKAASARR